MKKLSSKKISSTEQKKVLIQMLEYIDKICRKNDIKYSLIFGSLIGAIRHKGFIPWDDDVDIILDKDNYDKLIDILKNDPNPDYKIFVPGETPNYPVPFAKFINNRTSLKEVGKVDCIDDYGLFIDIFVFNNAPAKESERIKFYKKFCFYQFSLVKSKLNYGNPSFFHKLKRMAKNVYVTIFGYKRTLKKLLKLFNSYSEIYTGYVMPNDYSYSYNQAIQDAEDIKEYIDVKFEDIKVMVFKNYDKILRITYGDYMKLPPKSKRINHNLEVYWKEEN